jgi:hypothetical protein
MRTRSAVAAIGRRVCILRTHLQRFMDDDYRSDAAAAATSEEDPAAAERWGGT